MEQKELEMTIENLRLKIENQAKIIKELTNENEELYHQYNHLIIRNGKMLKRVDDFQKIIDDLHIRNEELQLINSNMMQINDKMRSRNEFSLTDSGKISSDNSVKDFENSYAKIDAGINLQQLFERWRNYPGQVAHNEPNLKKQVLMLVHLYSTPSLRAAELFNVSGVGGVTGARYISALKKFGLIFYTGARKKGCYKITEKGISFIKETPSQNNLPEIKNESEEKYTDQKSNPVMNRKQLYTIQEDHNDL